MANSNRTMTTKWQSGAGGAECKGTGVARSESPSPANCSSLALVLFLISSAANWSTLALVLFLISRLLRSWICKYVSFNTGMEHKQHEVVGGGGGGRGRRSKDWGSFHWLEDEISWEHTRKQWNIDVDRIFQNLYSIWQKLIPPFYSIFDPTRIWTTVLEQLEHVWKKWHIWKWPPGSLIENIIMFVCLKTKHM